MESNEVTPESRKQKSVKLNDLKQKTCKRDTTGRGTATQSACAASMKAMCACGSQVRWLGDEIFEDGCGGNGRSIMGTRTDVRIEIASFRRTDEMNFAPRIVHRLRARDLVTEPVASVRTRSEIRVAMEKKCGVVAS